MIQEYDGNDHVSYVNNPEAYVGRSVAHYSLGKAQIISASRYDCTIQITGGSKISSLWNELSLLHLDEPVKKEGKKYTALFVDCDDDDFVFECIPDDDRIFLISEPKGIAILGLDKKTAKEMRKILKKLIILLDDKSEEKS